MKIGIGEGGIPADNDDGTSSSSRSPLKRPRGHKQESEYTANRIATVIKTGIDLCNDNSKSKENESTVVDTI